MAKMGRRKRSRLITQGLMTSGKKQGEAAAATSAPVAKPVEAKAAPPKVEAPKAEAPKVEAPKAAEVAAPKSAGEPDIQALADRVKARRKENGWTQADVAKKGGPSAGAISQIERCLMETPAEDVLAKLDAALEWPSGTADGILRGADLVGAGK
ncbi:helix-turn-helix domain-containing protein [Nocardia sp. ET3-3]|uniref:Helix-turn-helix domain-containing protein n=1 Tax=Nocardia terrae TaxID=2675851 RepID=A0A7K1UTP1_9NOCA|nr:helix-turn-helix domain-containing protein [Nocardia terrae]MVU77641.1 helix-turn-helix domain-containing protein [Nocardia terrae]